jgi:hypothetical protein
VGVPQRQTPEIDAGLVGMLFEGVTRIEAAQRKEGKA